MRDTIKQRSEDLASALRRRFRTGPPQSSMSIRSLGTEQQTSAKRSLDEKPDIDYDPDSHEPRYLQMAKADLRNRKELRCKDCGYMGLPSPDQLCPECGGPMETPQGAEAPADPAMSTEQIRQAIRAQWAQKQATR